MGTAVKDNKQRTGRREPVLFAFPFAGGTSLSYMSWDVPGTRFMPLEYGGHGLRMNEPLPSSIQAAAEDAARQVAKSLSGEKFCLFGHSMGGIVAWHALHYLEKEYGLFPEKMVVSCCDDPVHFPGRCLSLESDADVLSYLKDDMRVSKKEMESALFQKKVLPSILNDFKIIREYRCEEEGVIGTPITAIEAEGDRFVKKGTVSHWQQRTSGKFELQSFPGGHFYFDDKEILGSLLRFLEGQILI